MLVRVSASLKARLSEIAKRERRSLSKQVEFLLERSFEISASERPVAPVLPKGQRRRS